MCECMHYTKPITMEENIIYSLTKCEKALTVLYARVGVLYHSCWAETKYVQITSQEMFLLYYFLNKTPATLVYNSDSRDVM